MRMGGTGVDLELLELLAAQRALGQHAADGSAHRFLRARVEQVPVGLLADAAGIAGVAIEDGLLRLVGRHDDLGRVDDDHEVAGIDVGSEDRLVLPPQHAGDLSGQPAQHEILGIDHMPSALDFWCLGRIRTHSPDFSEFRERFVQPRRARRTSGSGYDGSSQSANGAAAVASPPVIGLREIQDARQRVNQVVRPTPVAISEALSRLVGRPVLLKPEYRQRTGSFKIRGAYNLISRLQPGGEVVAASAGNHAQGVALAATLTGRRSTIFMPTIAPLPKVEATRSYGANVRLEGDVVDDCLALARQYADGVGAVYVHPFDDPLIIAGQGTLGLEIAEDAPEADAVVVPVGGGGLIAGVATALAHTRRSARVIGVEAEGAASVRRSLDAGRRVVLDGLKTMADGIAVRTPSDLTLAHINAYVDDVVTVSEESISAALLLLLERAKAVVEPAGAVGLAAALEGLIPGSGPIVVLLSGGNVDPLLLIKLIDHGLSAAGRYLILRIVLGDHPGALADLTRALARSGLNVLEVEHHRAGVAVAVDEVEVLVTLETRDPAHRGEVVEALTKEGYRVELVR